MLCYALHFPIRLAQYIGSPIFILLHTTVLHTRTHPSPAANITTNNFLNSTPHPFLWSCSTHPQPRLFKTLTQKHFQSVSSGPPRVSPRHRQQRRHARLVRHFNTKTTFALLKQMAKPRLVRCFRGNGTDDYVGEFRHVSRVADAVNGRA